MPAKTVPPSPVAQYQQPDPPVLHPTTQLYFQIVGAAITGYLTQRDSIMCNREDIAKAAMDLADVVMDQYGLRIGQTPT